MAASVVSAVAGVVGMIPEGLVLLTSLNFAVAAMRLARHNTLVQESNPWRHWLAWTR